MVALAISLAGASLLSRRITAAVQAAKSIGSGHLDATVPTSGPHEVIELGSALLQLAAHIDRLLTGERERAADLSHRLRTPLTVLALETQRLKPELAHRPDQLPRVNDSTGELEKGLDDLIKEFQNTRENGVYEQSDAAQVIEEHVAYWSALAQAPARQVDFTSVAQPFDLKVVGAW